MSSTAAYSVGLLLRGLDGSNPLAFLAALGTLRTLTWAWRDHAVQMAWRQECSAWRPVIVSPRHATKQKLLEALEERLACAQEVHNRLAELGQDLSVSPEQFKNVAQQAGKDAIPDRRELADYIAAFGSEVTTNDKGNVIQDTAFRTMAGAGHQHFLGFMRNICGATQVRDLEKSLFETWRYDDPVEKLTMRWDPIDDTRYALQWRNPSGDPQRKKGGNMLGANRLAIEGLPLFPTAPNSSRLVTAGFRGHLSRNTFWTWPIWSVPISLDVVRSLLTLAELQQDEPQRSELQPRGVVEVYRVQRVTIGKVRNFSPAHAP